MPIHDLFCARTTKKAALAAQLRIAKEESMLLSVFSNWKQRPASEHLA